MKRLLLILMMLPMVAMAKNGYYSTYPEGKYYVCYQARQVMREPFWPDKVAYHGCYQSMKKCPPNLHYGKYATAIHAKNGFKRCMYDAPMWRHPERLA